MGLSLVAGLPLLRGQTFGYLGDKIYCELAGEHLTIYVKKEAGLYKCADYIGAIEHLARAKYDEVMLVVEYIDQGDDVGYRKEVFEIKKQEFLKLVRYRAKILDAVDSFEEKFFLKYQSALYHELSPYLQTLKSQLNVLESAIHHTPTQPLQEKRRQVAQQILTLEAIFDAQSLDEIMARVPNYLYLKEQIE